MKMDTSLKSFQVKSEKVGYSFFQTLKFHTKTYLDVQN